MSISNKKVGIGTNKINNIINIPADKAKSLLFLINLLIKKPYFNSFF